MIYLSWLRPALTFAPTGGRCWPYPNYSTKLMPAQYVKRGKNDAADAEAICEAVTRPTMRFVANATLLLPL